MNTLGKLIETAEQFDSKKEDYRGDAYRFAINDGVEIAPFDMLTDAPLAPLPMTDHALSQLCTQVGSITPGVARALRANDGTRPHLGRALDVLREQRDTSERRTPMLVRSYNGNARAVLTTHYQDTPNTELLRSAANGIIQQAESAGQTVDIIDFPVGRSWLTPDKLHLYASIRTVKPSKDDPYGLGFVITNSEIGDGGLKLLPYIQRHACTNSIVLDSEAAFYTVHRGSGRLLAFTAAIGNALKLSFEGLEKLVRAREVEIPNVQKEIESLAERYGWETDVVASVGVGTEGSATVWGIVNGITLAAHTVHDDDPEARMEMEMAAGRYLLAAMQDADQ